MEPFLTRNEIQEELKRITQSTQDTGAVKTAMQLWMESKNCGEFEINQIMNDLTSYKEYLSLVN